MPSTPPAIELAGIRKTFGQKVAVENLDLTIEQGRLVGMIGPNGAGKTTTIRMVMSILFPDSGRLSVLGKASAIESKDRIGYLPEERGLYKKMKVGAFLTYMARLKGLDSAGLDATVRRWLERVELGDCARKKCEELSKGMQQKVQFIASIIHEPDLVILDEPFSGLDPVNSRLLTALIREQHQKGRTVIFSTHQMSQAEALCERIIMIHQGRKVLDNTPAEIRSRFDPRSLALGGLTDPALLQALPDIETVSAGAGHATVTLRPGVDARAALARVASAVPCDRIEIVRPTLEDVFVEIVQGSRPGVDRESLIESLRTNPASQSRRSGDRGGD